VKLSQSLYDLFEQHPELLDGQSWDQEAFDALSYEDQVYMLRDILAKAQASGENYVPMSAFLMTDGNGDFFGNFGARSKPFGICPRLQNFLRVFVAFFGFFLNIVERVEHQQSVFQTICSNRRKFVVV